MTLVQTQPPQSTHAAFANHALGLPRIESAAHWVADVAALCQPDSIEWITDSPETRARLTERLVQAGTLIRLNPELRPNSYLARSTPDDVARVEARTFICSRTKEQAGPTNNWREPTRMREELMERFFGSMAGRIMYVVPFSMGHEDSASARFGIEVTDSAYVALSMLTMTRSTPQIQAKILAGAPYVPALHSVGFPLVDQDGRWREDVPWPSNTDKYICHFPETREIWSYGSGYGGNALLGKKSFALRIASAIAHEEGWLAEHMLLIRATNPSGKVFHFVAAFPSACGKTNFAMLQPSLPGWTIETIGDDIVWMWTDAAGNLRATNPESGFFGVAPGTSEETNPVAMRTIERDTIFTNVALTQDGDVWWEGMSSQAPEGLTDWLGQPWDPTCGPAAHPNSRFTSSISNCPTTAHDWDDPQGFIVDGIIFGGRRATTMPVVAQAYSWEHGVLMGATIVSERTAAAEGTIGELRSDPFAMAPFLGYSVTEHWQHWLNMGASMPRAHRPEIFHVNWFRKSPEGVFAWPGFGENVRIVDWMTQRILARRSGESLIHDELVARTAAGYVPAFEGIDSRGLAENPQLREAFAVRTGEWRAELARQREYLDQFGLATPTKLNDVLDGLELLITERP